MRRPETVEYKKRHQRLWGFISFVGRILTKIKFNFTAPVNNIKGPFLLLCNHVTDWDPIMVGSSFKNQMYFVASEHIFRLGFNSRLISFFFSPIARQKGGSAAGTVKSILRTLKDGYNVCLFPEGNRSWDGKTGEFTESTGKLVRASGVSLVTYRLSGGYFSSPRWAGKSIRRGKMTGNVVGVYSPEQLKTMSLSDINTLISSDLAVDAYAEQRENPVSYKGKHLAEHLETVLFACPVCGRLHTLKSENNRLFCSGCGSEAEYTETGLLKGSFGFETVTEWVGWQDSIIDSLCKSDLGEPIFCDNGLRLLSVESAKGSRHVGTGALRLFSDRLELPGGISIPAKEVGGMSIRGDSLLFVGTSGGAHYQLSSESVFNAHKYLLACRKLGFINSFV